MPTSKTADADLRRAYIGRLADKIVRSRVLVALGELPEKDPRKLERDLLAAAIGTYPSKDLKRANKIAERQWKIWL